MAAEASPRRTRVFVRRAGFAGGATSSRQRRPSYRLGDPDPTPPKGGDERADPARAVALDVRARDHAHRHPPRHRRLPPRPAPARRAQRARPRRPRDVRRARGLRRPRQLPDHRRRGGSPLRPQRHRRPPLGGPADDLLVATGSVVRLGGRTGVVEVDVADGSGRRVAHSSQQIVFMGPPPDRATGTASEFRRAFLAWFDGTTQLGVPLADELGMRGGTTGDGAPAWWMPHTARTRNGFGGLHGGVAAGLVDAAAAGLGRGHDRTAGPHPVGRAALSGAGQGGSVPGRPRGPRPRRRHRPRAGGRARRGRRRRPRRAGRHVRVGGLSV